MCKGWTELDWAPTEMEHTRQPQGEEWRPQSRAAGEAGAGRAGSMAPAASV